MNMNELRSFKEAPLRMLPAGGDDGAAEVRGSEPSCRKRGGDLGGGPEGGGVALDQHGAHGEVHRSGGGGSEGASSDRTENTPTLAFLPPHHHSSRRPPPPPLPAPPPQPALTHGVGEGREGWGLRSVGL